MIPALLLLSSGFFGQTQDPHAFNFDGQIVALSMPQPSSDSIPPTDVASWSGWSSLGGQNPTFPTPFSGAGDWSDVQKSYLSSFGKSVVDWKLKVVILAKVDTLLKRTDGTWTDRRNELTGDRFLQTLNALPQLVALVSAMTGGKVHLVTDVHIDPEASRDTADAGKKAFDHGYLTRYLESRINGGFYEADDKKYRGPYDSVLVIDPTDHSEWTPGNGVFFVDDTPTAEVCFDVPVTGYEADGLAKRLFERWAETVSARAVARSLPAIQGNLDSVDWAAVADLKEVSRETRLARLATHPNTAFRSPNLPAGLSSPAYKTANIQLSMVKDPAKGEVLQYQESHVSRAGGVALPCGVIDPAKTPSLTVTYKTSSDQAICLSFFATGGIGTKTVQEVSLGRDPETAEPATPEAMSLPVQADGAWHTVTIDLKSLGLGTIGSIELGSSFRAATMTPEVAVPITYDFAEFRLGSDAATPPLPTPTADANSTDPESRCLAALQEAKAGQPSPVLAKLLGDPDPDVQLNAAIGYETVIDPYAEPKLIELSKSPSPRIGEFALKALAHQNTATANAAIESELKFGFEYNRVIAAQIIAARHDPKTAQDLVVLLAGQEWHTRLEAASALAEIPGPASDLMRQAILDQDDPLIKLEVIRNVDLKSDSDMRKMLWEAVNEPSDAVRAAACEELIQSSLPDMRTQGLKGVRDDSWWTRVLILDYLASNPTEDARGAIKLALQDSSALVRAAALRALNGLGKVGLDDLQPCLDDPSPDVDLALLAVAKKHALVFPDATMEIFKKSPDPSVQAALKSQGR